MLRTVKSDDATPATTYSLLLRIAVLLLVTQLVDSFAPSDSLRFSASRRQSSMIQEPTYIQDYEQTVSGTDFIKYPRINIEQSSTRVKLNYGNFRARVNQARSGGNIRSNTKRLNSSISGPYQQNHHKIVRENSSHHSDRTRPQVQSALSSANNDDLIESAIREHIFVIGEQWEAQHNSKNHNSSPEVFPIPAPPLDKTPPLSSRTHPNIRKPVEDPIVGRERTDERGQGNKAQDYPIVYPNDPKVIPKGIFTPRIQPECKGKTVCQKIESYPTEYVKNAVIDLKNFQALAGTDVIETIAQRIDGDNEDTPLCQSSETIWYPEGVKKDMTNEDTWHVVVNVDNFKQGLRIDTCLNPDGECTKIDGLTGDLKSGYAAICKQQHVHRTLVVLSRESGKPITDSFPIPSSCCCHVKFNGFAARFGGNTATAKNGRPTFVKGRRP